MQTLCKAWIISISLQGGVSSRIEEGVYLHYFYIEDVREPAKEGAEPAFKNTGRAAISKETSQKVWSVVWFWFFGVFFFPILRVNLLMVLFPFLFFLEWKIKGPWRLIAVPPSRHIHEKGWG